MSERTRKEYISRINRVMDHIEANLKNDLSLDELASVACFSPYHFHRIFRSMMGETLHQFTHRMRIQRIAIRLSNDPDVSITELVYEYGFSSSAHFSRSFKEFFGLSPSQWRKSQIDFQNSKIRQLNRNEWKSKSSNICYLGVHENQNIWRINMNPKPIEVIVKKVPDITIAYIRNVGPYQGDSKLFEALFQKLCAWAGPRGLITDTARFFACYHDDPALTSAAKLRLSIGLSVNEGVQVDGEIGKMIIPGGDYGIAYHEVKSPEQFQSAWDAVYGQWLPESGYQPNDSVCYEEYLNDPKTHPEGLMKVNIAIPLKPL